MFQKSLWILLVQECVIFIDPVDSRQIVDIQKVQTSLQQLINWIILTQKQSLLFLVPIGLGRFKTNTRQPVSGRFQPNDADVFGTFELLIQSFVRGNGALGGANIGKDIFVDAGHGAEGTLLHLVGVLVQGVQVVDGELGFDHLFLEVGWEVDRYLVGERVTVVQFDVAT